MQKHFLRILPVCVAAFLALLPAAPLRAQSARIHVDATINSKPVRLILDTGSNATVLFRGAAKRLGLKIIRRPKDAPQLRPGEVAVDATEESTWVIGSATSKGSCSVMDFPSYLDPKAADFDGFLSWENVTSDAIEINGKDARPIRLPKNIASWTKWKIVPGDHPLLFEREESGRVTRIGLDTGDFSGIQLSKENWKAWRAAHANQPATLDDIWDPADGVEIPEILRASKIQLGGLSLKDVPVMQEYPSSTHSFSHSDAVLGLFVLTRTRLILDKKDGFVYTLPISNPKEIYNYNRLGAIFVPNNLETDISSVAHVAKGSPADKAGIRDGDILLHINDVDVSGHRMPTSSLAHDTLSQPPGTRVKLIIKRGWSREEYTIPLQELGVTGWEPQGKQ